MKKILTLTILAATFTAAQAQDSWLNVLRSDVRTQVSALMEVAMEFSDEEAEVFWPIYREFELESSKLAVFNPPAGLIERVSGQEGTASSRWGSGVLAPVRGADRSHEQSWNHEF